MKTTGFPMMSIYYIIQY